ncbi:MAG: hypothetical protein V1854_04875 [Methanobacteriota archaeon]
MKLSTTITKRFFEMKMQDLSTNGFFIEYKEDKPFWKKRIDNILKEYDLRVYGFLGKTPEIVFLVGSEPYRFKVVNIFYTHNIPEEYASAINTEFTYALKCVSIDACNRSAKI